jgi:hypothetical protein
MPPDRVPENEQSTPFVEPDDPEEPEDPDPQAATDTHASTRGAVRHVMRAA